MKSDELDPTEDQAVRIVAEAARLPTSPVGPHLGDDELRRLVVRKGLNAGVEEAAYQHIESCPSCADAALDAFHAFEKSNEASGTAEPKPQPVMPPDDLVDSEVREWIRLLVSVGQSPGQIRGAVHARGAVRTRGASRSRGPLDGAAPSERPQTFDQTLADLARAKDRVRHDVVSALGTLGGPASVAALCHLALRDPEPSVRSEAAGALGRIGGAPAMAALQQAAADADETIRATAVDALGSLISTAVEESEKTAIRECLRRIVEADPSPSVRERAARIQLD